MVGVVTVAVRRWLLLMLEGAHFSADLTVQVMVGLLGELLQIELALKQRPNMHKHWLHSDHLNGPSTHHGLVRLVKGLLVECRWRVPPKGQPRPHPVAIP